MKISTYTCSTGILSVPDQFVGENDVTSLVINFTDTLTDTWSKGVVIMPFKSEGFPVLLGSDIIVNTLIPAGWLLEGRLTIQPYAVSPTTQVMKFPIRVITVGKSLGSSGAEEVLTPSVLVQLEASLAKIFSDVTALQTGKSDVVHIHDDRYYTESETNTLLNDKVDKVLGKGLILDTEITRLASVTNYDDTQVLQNIIDLQDNKVDKVLGKGLSSNDFTDVLKSKLVTIEEGAEVNTVTSVATRTGNVVLTKSDVGLANVDNTSDVNKPISTAQATSIATKVDKVIGKGLSTEDYTTAEKTKVANVPLDTNAQFLDIVGRELQRSHLANTLPNGVANEFVDGTLVKKVERKVLTDSDFPINAIVGGINVNILSTTIFTDNKAWVWDVINTHIEVIGKEQVRGASADNVANIGKYYVHPDNTIRFVIPKGITLVEAKSMWLGQEILYELNESRSVPLPEKMSPNTETLVDLAKSYYSYKKSINKKLRPMISVTFDDGFKSHHDIAYPVLMANGIRGTFYVMSGFFNDPSFVNADMVKEMSGAGQEIACHTENHRVLTALSNEQILAQLKNNKMALERATGKPVLTHAYPEGAVDDRVANLTGAFYEAARGVTRQPFGAGRMVYGDSKIYNVPVAFYDQIKGQLAINNINSFLTFCETEPAWFIIAYHNIHADSDPNKLATRNTESEFTATMQYLSELKKNGIIDVVPFYEGARRISTAQSIRL